MAFILRALIIGYLAFLAVRLLKVLIAKISLIQPEGPSGDSRGASSGSRHSGLDPYQVLSLSRQASPDEVKKAYRHLLAKYHPDKVSHLGQELQELAHKKTQDISWAYRQLS